MNRTSIIFFIFSAVMISACNNKRDVRIPSGDIYFDYSIHGEEGNDNVTVLLQYLDGGEGEDAIDPGPSTQVSLDDELISPDSTAVGGIFYETHKPLTGFAGKHVVVFKEPGGKESREEFNFEPVVLVTAMADTITRGDLEVEFSGLEQGDRVRVLMTDTSFINDGINRVEKIRDSRLLIPAASLNRLANGPVQLEFIREFERRVRVPNTGSGRLRISYSLKREFFLADPPGSPNRGGLQRIYTLK